MQSDQQPPAPAMKRSFAALDDPEAAMAEDEVAAVVAAAAAQPADQLISGISASGVTAPVYCEVPAAVPRPAQYRVPAGEPLLFTYCLPIPGGD